MKNILRILHLLLPFVFLITVTLVGGTNAFLLIPPIGSLPTIAHASGTSINYIPLPQLNKPEQITSRLVFGVVSDIHVLSTNQVAQNKFQQMLGDMVQLRVPNLIINGDLGDGAPQDYQTLRSLISSQKNSPTIFYTIGNHEFYKANRNPITNAWSPETFPNGETEVLALDRFLKLTGRDQVYYDAYLKGYHFIFLGSEKSAISDRSNGDRAYLSSEQLEWLESKLQENYSPGKPIFVFLHQPLSNLGSSENSFIIQADRLREILKQIPEVIFFSGHIHRQLDLPTTVRKDGYIMINSSSVYLPLNSQGKLLPDESEGFVVEVTNNKVVMKGRDFVSKAWIPNTRHEFLFRGTAHQI